MILTAKQEEGVRIAVARYKAKEPWTCIAGYAGVGKSTLIQHIIQALNLHELEVAYITFTGKAALVLQHKGCPNAMTAHKFLYHSSKTPSGKFVFKPKSKRQIGEYKLVVVDEISMLDKDIWNLLLTHKIHIIACGDPFQIPPLNPEKDNHVLDNPHIFLDEILRQAAESEIIRLSMKIRNNNPIEYFKGKEVQVIKPYETVSGMYEWADQIICATNKKKDEINSYVRNIKGKSFEPDNDDKLICTQNRWDITDFIGSTSLVNGSIGTIDRFERKSLDLPFLFDKKKIDILNLDLSTNENEMFVNLLVDYKYLTTGKPTLTSEEEYRVYKINESLIPVKFDYGYAITGHRSQGSEWEKVMVLEESFPFDKETHARWLYTACTRASERLVLVR